MFPPIQISTELILVDQFTITHECFMCNIDDINTISQHVKVGNKLYYVDREEYIRLCCSGRYTKYRIHVYSVKGCGRYFIKLMWIEK